MRNHLILLATFSLTLPLVACTGKTDSEQAANKDSSDATTTSEAKPDFVMRRLAHPGKISVKIVGGVPADPTKYPATLTIDDSNCTATVVGSQAILTAAHCISGGGKGSLDIQPVPIGLTCSIAPLYPKAGVCSKDPLAPNCGRDIAMCRASSPIPLGANVKYEVVASSPAQVPTKGAVVILGYGCTAAGKPSQHVLHVGAPPMTSGATEGGQGEAQFIKLTGGAFICSGDSGGGAFDTAELNSRFVIAVNSAFNASARVSYLAPVLGSNHNFLESWAKTNNAPICGITPAAQNCRH